MSDVKDLSLPMSRHARMSDSGIGSLGRFAISRDITDRSLYCVSLGEVPAVPLAGAAASEWKANQHQQTPNGDSGIWRLDTRAMVTIVHTLVAGEGRINSALLSLFSPQVNAA